MITKQAFTANWAAEKKTKTAFTEEELSVLYGELTGFETPDELMCDPHTLSMSWGVLTKEQLINDYRYLLDKEEEYAYEVSLRVRNNPSMVEGVYEMYEIPTTVEDMISELKEKQYLTITPVLNPEIVDNIVHYLGEKTTCLGVGENFVINGDF